MFGGGCCVVVVLPAKIQKKPAHIHPVIIFCTVRTPIFQRFGLFFEVFACAPSEKGLDSHRNIEVIHSSNSVPPCA